MRWRHAAFGRLDARCNRRKPGRVCQRPALSRRAARDRCVPEWLRRDRAEHRPPVGHRHERARDRAPADLAPHLGKMGSVLDHAHERQERPRLDVRVGPLLSRLDAHGRGLAHGHCDGLSRGGAALPDGPCAGRLGAADPLARRRAAHARRSAHLEQPLRRAPRRHARRRRLGRPVPHRGRRHGHAPRSVLDHREHRGQLAVDREHGAPGPDGLVCVDPHRDAPSRHRRTAAEHRVRTGRYADAVDSLPSLTGPGPCGRPDVRGHGHSGGRKWKRLDRLRRAAVGRPARGPRQPRREARPRRQPDVHDAVPRAVGRLDDWRGPAPDRRPSRRAHRHALGHDVAGRQLRGGDRHRRVRRDAGTPVPLPLRQRRAFFRDRRTAVHRLCLVRPRTRRRRLGRHSVRPEPPQPAHPDEGVGGGEHGPARRGRDPRCGVRLRRVFGPGLLDGFRQCHRGRLRLGQWLRGFAVWRYPDADPYSG